MSDVLHDLSRVQAARPTFHWLRCTRLLAWFRVLMFVSLVKRPASAGLLSRIGDYLLLQHEGLGSDDNRTDAVWHGHHQRRPSTVGTMTRSPPQPLLHRRALRQMSFEGPGQRNLEPKIDVMQVRNKATAENTLYEYA